MTIAELNQLDANVLREEFTKCCGASAWTNGMILRRPFATKDALLKAADEVWNETNENDWLEAFLHHPKIGDLKSLEKKFATTSKLAGSEQASVNSASQDVLEALAKGNAAYENKFGFIFIVCATGKSASEMLELLNTRIHNDKQTELKIAAAEQHKITHLRLQKLVP